MRRLLNLMVGELNASHLGVSAGRGGGRGGGEAPSTGHLGVRFDRAEYERAGTLKVTQVIPLGPAAITRQISVGDYIAAIDGVPVTRDRNVDEMLLHSVNRRTSLTVSAA
jgi:C-terminal processing protease CtpA/Prc